MKLPALLISFALAAVCFAAKPSTDYPIQPVPFTAVHLHDRFWAPRIETNRTVSIPTAFEQCDRTGRIENFVRAAEVLQGQTLTDKHSPGYPFDDTDLYKVIEGASYALSVHPDPKLKAYVDSLIQKIKAAQEPDGYLYTTRTIDPQHPHPWAGNARWVNEEILSHELYNCGHLYEAAVANYQATGERTLLDVALKNANLLVKTFGPGKRKIYPGHQIVEMGLVKLYRVTGDQQYLALARFMLDSRGPGGKAYNQADVPPVDQTEAEGHAVRAGYMYSGMADVAALTGDPAYLKAIDLIWNNMVDKKYYITGGVGALGQGEAFGVNYQLPNMTAYNETCAAIASDFWDQRLFLLHGDAKYVDVFERTLYNGLLSGVALDGKTYFYPNPLESNGQHQRSPWFGVACCPGNITRFLPSVPGYVYAQKDAAIYVNLYMSNSAALTLPGGGKVTLVQQTDYPWSGDIKLTVDPVASGEFALKLRVPGWAREAAVPGDLYRFAHPVEAPISLKVNGKPVPVSDDQGYATLARHWKKGDRVELSLPMPVRRVVANGQVEADRGLVALERGPIVFCAEWPDSPDKHVRNLVLARDTPLKARFEPALLHGIEVIEGQAIAFHSAQNGSVEHSTETLTAIPYYAWANRGPGQMEVWIAESEEKAHPTPFPTLASESKVTASGPTVTSNGMREPRLVADGEPPASSADRNSYFAWAPGSGDRQWLEYDFRHPATVSSAAVYWFCDQGTKLPRSWRLLYKQGDEWKPVAVDVAYDVEPDRYNKVAFAPVKTEAMRLEVELEPGANSGVEEWQVQ